MVITVMSEFYQETLTEVFRVLIIDVEACGRR